MRKKHFDEVKPITTIMMIINHKEKKMIIVIIIIIMLISPGWPVGGLSEFFTGETNYSPAHF